MKRDGKINTGIVFGVFDGLHEGHKHFLKEASGISDELVVVLTPPETSLLLKGRLPRHSYEEREKAIKEFNPRITVVPGDTKPGSWSVLRNRKSCTIILGYDQEGIAKEMEKMGVSFVSTKPHRPDIYKSSLLLP